MERHVFNCTLGFALDGSSPLIKVVSEDSSIHHSLPVNAELLGLFDAGEHQIKCEGFWDNAHSLVWLGKKLDG